MVAAFLTDAGSFNLSGGILLLPSFKTTMFEKLQSLYWKIMEKCKIRQAGPCDLVILPASTGNDSFVFLHVIIQGFIPGIILLS